jgi:hypothetical protein
MVYFTDRDKEHSYAYLDGQLVGLVKDWSKFNWLGNNELPWQANICNSFCDLDHPHNHSNHATKEAAQKWLEDMIQKIVANPAETQGEGGE